MISSLRYTLVTDGSSDFCLTRIIDWVLKHQPSPILKEFQPQLADFRLLAYPPKDLRSRLREAYRLWPCELLFVHRDAESDSIESRIQEIEAAIGRDDPFEHVPVVPVRMTEAWLLFDERAIRRAADNPNGAVSLDLPPLNRIERLPEPKQMLEERLKIAAEKTGRHLERFCRDLPHRKLRVADLIDDFSPLRQLEAFRHFEDATRQALNRLDDVPAPGTPLATARKR